MPLTLPFSRTAALFALLALAAAGPARGQVVYTFTDVADTSAAGAFASLGLDPNLNAAGTVAFTGQLAAGGAAGVFSGSGGNITTVASSAGGVPLAADSAFESPRINASGAVVFRAGSADTGINGIFARTGAGLATVADNGGNFADVFTPALNGAGQVAFAALPAATGAPGVFRQNLSGGAPVTVASAPGDFSGLGPRTFINAGGAVALVAARGGATAGTDLLLGDGSAAPVPVANAAALGLSSLDLGVAPHVSDDGGTVTFLGTRASNHSRGVFQLTLASGTLTALVETGDGAFSDISAFSLASGRLAFLGTVTPTALDPDGTRGLFNGASPLLNRIVTEGDLLLVNGNLLPVGSLGFTDGGLNNNGQVAFYAGFADANNTAAIFRADVAPEPGSIPLLLGGAGAAAGLALRRHRRLRRPALSR